MKKLTIFLFSCFSLFAKYGPENKDGPWYTGSFFSTSGEVVELGSFDMQGYIFVQQIYGRYNRNFSLEDSPGVLLVNPVFQVQTGVAPKVDTQLTGSGTYQKTEGAFDFAWNDFTIQIGMQLFKTSFQNPWPSVRLTITETLPTGKFDEGDPKKEGTDLGGMGSIQSALGLNLQNIYFLDTIHPIRMRLNLWVTIPTRVKVKGVNFFGGDGLTRGKVDPGVNLEIIYSPEFTLTQNWVFAFDFIYDHFFPNGFKGRVRLDEDEPFLLGARDSFQFSPVLEYNFNGDSGLLFGAWFTLLGKRSPAFAGGAFSFIYAW